MNEPKQTQQTQMYYWLLALPLALGLLAIPTACAPEPVAAKRAQTASMLLVEKQRAADAAVAELEAVYSRMSDEERMRGVVYE